MPGILIQVTSIAFFISIAQDLISWIRVWEEKDFNLRRLLIYIKETKSGRSLILGWVGVIKWLVILLYGVTIYVSQFDFYFHIVVFGFYALQVARIIKKILDREFKTPSFSISFFLIFTSVMVFVIALFLLSPVDRFLWILILDKSMALFVVFFIFLISVFFDFGRDVVINRALNKMDARRDFLSIAIVGSYGRGSTKEFISKVLAAKYNVAVTDKSFVNDLGIARTILRDLSQNKRILITEMDDFKPGDIREMSNIAKPSIAVICGIDEQKLSEYGSMDRLIDAKFEVVETLPRSGITIFNGDSINTHRLYRQTHVKKYLYSTDKKNKPDILATNVRESRFSLSFDVLTQGKRYKFSNIKLLTRQNILNLLPAIFLGLHLGIDLSELKTALAALRPLPGSMDPKIARIGAIFIDDTYNSNINSVLSAVSYLALYKKRRVLVLEPLSDLGKFSSEIHHKLGIEAGKVCDNVFLTNGNFSSQFRSGVLESNPACRASVATTAKIISFIKTLARGDVVLFEGREASASLSHLPCESVY